MEYDFQTILKQDHKHWKHENVYLPDRCVTRGPEMMFHDCIMKYHDVNDFTAWQRMGDRDRP